MLVHFIELVIFYQSWHLDSEKLNHYNNNTTIHHQTIYQQTFQQHFLFEHEQHFKNVGAQIKAFVPLKKRKKKTSDQHVRHSPTAAT